jgi:hypothetical protein
VTGRQDDTADAGRLSVPKQRLDEEKVETLRLWGEGLQNDPREEVRAAGRAITLLVEEIEALNVDLWNARADRLEQGPFKPQGDRPTLPPPLPSM